MRGNYATAAFDSSCFLTETQAASLNTETEISYRHRTSPHGGESACVRGRQSDSRTSPYGRIQRTRLLLFYWRWFFFYWFTRRTILCQTGASAAGIPLHCATAWLLHARAFGDLRYIGASLRHRPVDLIDIWLPGRTLSCQGQHT